MRCGEYSKLWFIRTKNRSRPSGSGVNAPAGAGGGYQVTEDPRYWQLQYDQLAEDLQKAGMTAENARRQALATLIDSRNTNSAALARTSGDIAKTAADFAA